MSVTEFQQQAGGILKGMQGCEPECHRGADMVLGKRARRGWHLDSTIGRKSPFTWPQGTREGLRFLESRDSWTVEGSSSMAYGLRDRATSGTTGS